MKCLAVLLVPAALVVACGGGESGDGDVGSDSDDGSCAAGDCPEPTGSCPAGFAEAEHGGCAPILADAECPAGTRPVVGLSSCAPVGWTECPTGFVPDPSGWGCADVTPPSACAGATRDALGDTECQPIGDCNAPFPPADATYFVRASYTDAELDDTHYRTVGDALAAAPSGAVIAVDEGVYLERLTISEPISIVGRCAEKVILQSDGADLEGVRIDDAPDVLLRGMTIAGHYLGVLVNQSTLRLEDSLLSDNRWVSAVAVGIGAELTIERSVVRDTVIDHEAGPTHAVAVTPGGRVHLVESAIVNSPYAGLVLDGKNATATVTDSIIRDSHPEPDGAFAGAAGYGVIVVHGAAIEVERTVLADNHAAALGVASPDAEGTPASGHLKHTVIRGQRFNAVEAARGLEAADGGQLFVEDSAVVLCPEMQLIAETAGTLLHAERVVLRGPVPGDDTPSGLGVVANDQARVELVSTAVVSNRVMGLFVQKQAEVDVRDSLVQGGLPSLEPSVVEGETYYHGVGAAVLPGSRLSITSSTLVNNQSMGVFVRGEGALATITGTLIDDTQPDAAGIFGRGINVQDGARLEVTGSAILRSHEVGVVTFASEAKLIDSVVAETRRGVSPEFKPAFDVAASDGARLELASTTLSASPDIGLVVSGAAAFVHGGFLAGNMVALHVQNGTILIEQPTPSDDPLTAVVAPTTRFVANESRLGTGVVPMPSPAIGK